MQDPKTAQDTRPNTDPDDGDEISLLDLLQVVVDHLRLLFIGPIIAGLLALGISFLITPTFTAKTVFLPPQQQQSAASSMLASLGALGGLAGGAAGLKSPADQYLAYLKSTSLQDALIDRFHLMSRYEQKYKESTRKELSQNARATANAKDGLITIEVDDHDPQFAADLANGHVEELRKLLGTLAVTEAQQRRLFFEKQLKQTKENLASADSALRATGISESVLKANPTSAVAAVANLRAQITAQEVKLGAMRGYMAETSPEIKQALNELSSLRAQLAKQGQDTVPAPSAGNAKAGGQVNAMQDDYVSKYREYKYQEALFDLFTKQYELAQVDEAREGAVVQVLDPATPPELKSKPKKAMVAIVATLATFFLLLLYVFVRNAFKSVSQNAEMQLKILALRSAWRRALGRA